MKFFAISALAAVSLLAGCAASSSDSTDEGQAADLTSRPQIELKSTSDASSLQAKLFKLLTIDGDKTKAVQSIEGKDSNGTNRAMSCTASHLISAVVGSGVSSTAFYGCTLVGFDKGGVLPSVMLGSTIAADEPLAGKLVELMASAQKKGGFEVERSADATTPPCCDIPIKTTYSISDATQTLSCTQSTGGFAFMRSAECKLTQTSAVASKVEKGTLVHTVGIGGENTGFSAKVGSDVVELVLSDADRTSFVDGRVARITGTPTTLSGVETHDRPALKVTNLLVCPAAHATLDMMPPVSEDNLWLSKNCADLDIVE